MNELLLYGLLAAYFIYSLKFSLEFYKANIYSGIQKNINLVLIWVIPFLWSLLLKTVGKPTSGSHQYSGKRRESSFYESGQGF